MSDVITRISRASQEIYSNTNSRILTKAFNHITFSLVIYLENVRRNHKNITCIARNLLEHQLSNINESLNLVLRTRTQVLSRRVSWLWVEILLLKIQSQKVESKIRGQCIVTGENDFDSCKYVVQDERFGLVGYQDSKSFCRFSQGNVEVWSEYEDECEGSVKYCVGLVML